MRYENKYTNNIKKNGRETDPFAEHQSQGKESSYSSDESDVSMSGAVGTSTVTFRRSKVYTAR